MKYTKLFLLFTLAIIMTAVTENSAQIYGGKKSKEQDTQTSVATLPSGEMERVIFKALIRLPRYEVFDHIAFKVDGSTVTLQGKVLNAVNKKDAERSVKKVAGVANVVNNIKVLPPSPFDDSIRRRTLRTIAQSGGLFRYFQGVNPSVRIIVDGGHVELEGFVANRADSDLMNILANGVSNVFSVKNNLIVEKEIAR